MQTKGEILARADQLYNWFLEVRSEFSLYDLTLVGDTNYSRKVYFKGNVTTGDWMTTTPKNSPMFRCEYNEFMNEEIGKLHGLGKSYLEFRLPYSNLGSSDDWMKVSEEQFKNECRISFDYCIKYFIEHKI